MLLPVVAIPARNEVERLPILLAALAAQTVARIDQPLRIVIVLNNSDDGSSAAVATAQARYPQLSIDLLAVTYPAEQAHVGTARKQAMHRAREHIGDSEGAILTTDADAVPPPDWIEQNLLALGAGAHLVGGQIFGDPAEEAAYGAGFLRRAQLIGQYGRLCDELSALIDPIAHDPWPRHQDHTGGSLAVLATVYDAVGGMPALPFREDLAFVDRVLAHGFRLVHPLAVTIMVSARLKGRAPGGMADCIASWVKAEAEAEPILVEDPQSVMERAQKRHRIRRLLGRPAAEWDETLTELGADPAELAALQYGPADIARLLQQLAGNEPDAPATMPIAMALAEIETNIADVRKAEHAA